MKRCTGIWALVLGILLTAGCGGDAEQDRIDLLTSNPSGSLEASCNTFLAQVGEKTAWKVVGTPEMKVGAATEEAVGSSYYSEGCHLGLLKVTLADKEAKETAFRFVFVSVPVYGTWMLSKVGTIDAAGQIQTYGGDTDAFYEINAEQGRHPGA